MCIYIWIYVCLIKTTRIYLLNPVINKHLYFYYFWIYIYTCMCTGVGGYVYFILSICFKLSSLSTRYFLPEILNQQAIYGY